MRIVQAVNVSRQTVLADRVTVASSFLTRGWGLLGRASLDTDEGMLITNTNCVHSIFMRFPFDAIYIDRNGRICALTRQLLPFRIGPIIRQARQVLELKAGTIDRTGTLKGDVLAFHSGQDAASHL